MENCRHILIVVNPASGRSDFQSKLQYLTGRLKDEDLDYEVCFTKHLKDDELISYIERHPTLNEVFVMGGDGTLNQVVNELTVGSYPISIVSNGTGNDTVKSLHGVLDFQAQVEIAISGRIKKFDLGLCNDRYFVNGVGIGFDGEVVKDMVQRGDKRGRHIDYLLTVLRILGGFKEKPVHFVLNGESLNKNILLMTISNGSTFGGGFVLNPSAQTDDGLLDICLINEIPAWLRFWHVPKLKKGTHTRIKESEFFTTEVVKIEESSDLVAHLDGEYIGHPPFDISIEKGVLPIRVPA